LKIHTLYKQDKRQLLLKNLKFACCAHYLAVQVLKHNTERFTSLAESPVQHVEGTYLLVNSLLDGFQIDPNIQDSPASIYYNI